MKRIAEGLFKVCLMLATSSLFGFVIVGGVEIAVSSDGVVGDATYLAICALLFVLAVAIGLCGFALEQIADYRATKAARLARRRRPMIPLQPMEKEPGYNKEVVAWFHGGPELRERDAEFHQGFAARSQVPAPRRKKA